MKRGREERLRKGVCDGAEKRCTSLSKVGGTVRIALFDYVKFEYI